MSARTQSLLLLLFGAALLRLGTSDLLLRFVKDSARPWVLISGAAMVLLAVWGLVADARRAAPRAADEPVDEPVDEHGHGVASRASWLIVLPVVAVLVIGPPALGRFTVQQRDPITPIAVEDDFAPLPSTDPVRMRVFDFALRAASKGRASITGRTVELTGFVAATRADGFTLARLVIACCAADAAPVTVRVRTPQKLPENAWVRVTGRYAGQDPADSDLATLTARTVTPIAAPAEPYD